MSFFYEHPPEELSVTFDDDVGKFENELGWIESDIVLNLGECI